ncbi:MAG: sensor histidine kinase [Thermoplasmata archaeon]
MTPRPRALLAVVVAGAIFRRDRPVGPDALLPFLLESVSGGMLLLDRSHKVRFATGSVHSLLGYEPGEMVGRDVSAFVDPESHAALRTLLESAADLRPDHRAEVNGLGQGGRRVPLRLSARRGDDHGAPVYALYLQDLAEREALVNALALRAAELARSNRDLEQFAYVASHDLQEPLRMVGSYTQLVHQRYEGQLDADGREYLQFAHDGVLRMQEMIDDLLTFARLGSRGQPFAAISLDRIGEQALTNLEVAVRTRKAQVQVDPLPVIQGDRVQLVQLFQNLIGNALKFCKSDVPRVRVRVADSGSEWTVTVSDNGIGISPEFQEKVFQIFQRLHTREEYPGSGIGLSICRRVVERHGGRIWVESTGTPGEGTAFHFTFPKSGPAPATVAASAPVAVDAGVAERAQQLIEDRLRELI